MTIDEPVGSGLSYLVTHIDGHQPGSLQDFTGEVQLTVTQNGAPTQLIGVGGETVDGVRFYQRIRRCMTGTSGSGSSPTTTGPSGPNHCPPSEPGSV
jgi:hypothetical protein